MPSPHGNTPPPWRDAFGCKHQKFLVELALPLMQTPKSHIGEVVAFVFAVTFTYASFLRLLRAKSTPFTPFQLSALSSQGV